MTEPRVSFFVHDLSANPLGRALPLAQALAPDYAIEVIGFRHGDGINATYRDLATYRVVPCARGVGAVLRAMPRLAALATGDVIYACKPLLTSLGPALLASGFGRTRPLLIDAEDDEWTPMGRTWRAFVRRDLIGGWRHATAWKYTQFVRPFVRCASAITVSTRALQRRYGGTIVRHGPDERQFDPARAAPRDETRARYGLPKDAPIALFAGTPHAHKGLDILREALNDARARDWHLALAGDPDDPAFVACAREIRDRCVRLGFVSRADMPSLLHAVDAVPLPQAPDPFAESQLPAKLLDAMAMGVAVAASRVGDLPEILGDGARGWLVPPADSAALALALRDIADRPAAGAERGAAARRWFLEEASRSAIRQRLLPLLAAVRSGRGSVSAESGS